MGPEVGFGEGLWSCSIVQHIHLIHAKKVVRVVFRTGKAGSEWRR